MKEFLTVEEISSELKVPKSWIYSRTRLKGSDQIPHLKCGRYCRFEMSRVIEWLNDQMKQNMEQGGLK